MFLTGGGARWEGWCRNRGSCTPSRVFCSAELYIPCKMGNMSLRDTGREARFVSAALCTAALGRLMLLQRRGRKAQLCPPRRKGIPEASPSSCRGSRCHVLWHHETSVLGISCRSEAGIPGCQGGFRPDPVLLHSNGILH